MEKSLGSGGIGAVYLPHMIGVELAAQAVATGA
jgi:hypothetical protein